MLAVYRFRPKATAASLAQTLQTDDARANRAATAAKSVDARTVRHEGEGPEQL
jgi:hypothetical protein